MTDMSGYDRITVEAMEYTVNQQKTHWIISGDLLIHAVVEGDAKATPLVLVHGYPDNLQVWDQVTQRLKGRYLIIRYDVRGAGKSAKPGKTNSYKLSLLAKDLEAVVNALIPGRGFHLIAHDWGSIQCWESVTGDTLKDRILSYTSISGPCLDHVGWWIRDAVSSANLSRLKRVADQLTHSWYVFMFQIPIVPETIWRIGLDKYWPDYLKKHEEISDAKYHSSQRDDGQYGVKLYRANFVSRLLNPRIRVARCPVQVIVPKRDAYVRPQLLDGISSWVADLKILAIDAPHWAPITQPERVAQAVSQFVTEHS